MAIIAGASASVEGRTRISPVFGRLGRVIGVRNKGLHASPFNPGLSRPLSKPRRPDRASRRSVCAAGAPSSAARDPQSRLRPRGERSPQAQTRGRRPRFLRARGPICSPRNGQRQNLAASPVKWRRKARGVLGLQAAVEQDQRARRLFLEIGHGLGEHAAAGLVMAAVEPNLGAARAQRGEPPPLRFCNRPGQSALATPVS